MNNNEKQKNKNDKSQRFLVNYNIRCRNVRVIDDGNGNNLGLMSVDSAIERATTIGLDLVQIGFNAGVAICKMCDYGKFQYDQKKKEKEARKRSKSNIQEVKEVVFTLRIDENDKNTKIKHIREFIDDNCKVKISLQFSKRELDRISYGKDVLKSVMNAIEDIVEFDITPQMEARKMFCVVKPKKR